MTHVSRRSVVKGVSWAAPTVAVAAAAPAFAASKPTATNVTPQSFSTVYSGYDNDGTCNPTTNAQKGYIDSMPDAPTSTRTSYRSPVTPPDTAANSRRDGTSNGIWFEAPTAGKVTIVSATMTYQFFSNSTGTAPLAVKAITCPSEAPGDIETRTTTLKKTTWTSCDILNGWTKSQPATNQIQLSYTQRQTVDVSTSVTGTGWATGYFANFSFPGGCPRGTVYRRIVKTIVYIDASGTAKTWSTQTPIQLM